MKAVKHKGSCKLLQTGSHSTCSASPKSDSPGHRPLGVLQLGQQSRPTDPKSGVLEALFVTRVPGDARSLQPKPGPGFIASCHRGREQERSLLSDETSPCSSRARVHIYMKDGKMQSGRSCVSHKGFWPLPHPDLPT